jgi:hypothetical protein
MELISVDWYRFLSISPKDGQLPKASCEGVGGGANILAFSCLGVGIQESASCFGVGARRGAMGR